MAPHRANRRRAPPPKVWEKLTNYVEIEPRWVANRPGAYYAANEDLVAAADENTIGGRGALRALGLDDGKPFDGRSALSTSDPKPSSTNGCPLPTARRHRGYPGNDLHWCVACLPAPMHGGSMNHPSPELLVLKLWSWAGPWA
jgi:hypothetical protein